MAQLTTHKKGLKMEGFLSLNVSLCDFCMKMRENKDCICSQCYAYYMSCRYKRLREMLKVNASDLSGRILDNEELNEIVKPVNSKAKVIGLRFDSLGELINDIHVINLQNIAYKVESKPVTLWTKRLNLLFSVVKNPAFKVIYSNPMINSYIDPKVKDSRVTNTFNVYSDKALMHKDMAEAEEKGMKVFECKGSCKACMKCYNHDQTTKHVIFELTKKAASKAE